MNKKKLAMAGVAGFAAASAIAGAKKSSGPPKPEFWDKMRAKMEEMPEDFPPRVMFDNVQAARANTERILELLETREA